jgi:hypothetical protein
MKAGINPIFKDDFIAPFFCMQSVSDILSLETEKELLGSEILRWSAGSCRIVDNPSLAKNRVWNAMPLGE